MLDELVVFAEGAFVQEQLETLARAELALAVLGSEAFLTTTQKSSLLTLGKAVLNCLSQQCQASFGAMSSSVISSTESNAFPYLSEAHAHLGASGPVLEQRSAHERGAKAAQRSATDLRLGSDSSRSACPAASGNCTTPGKASSEKHPPLSGAGRASGVLTGSLPAPPLKFC